GRADARHQVRSGARLGGDAGEHLGVDPAPGDVELELALNQLGQLAHHPRHRRPGDVVAAAAVQGGTGELTHLDEGDVGQVGKPPPGESLAAAAGAEDDVLDSAGGADVDGLHHARPPRGGRVGVDDPGGAEDADAADDSQP